MKTYHFIFLILTLFADLLSAQSGNQLTPVWERSYGDRLLSSSDDVSFIFSDAQKNIVLVGKVEHDSTYGDLMIQKISPDGQLLWQFRFSSEKGENYDTPGAALLSNEGDLYVLGFAAILGNFTGYGFLLKISSDGQLIWQKDMTSLIPNHLNCWSWHMFLDSTGDLRLAYSVYMPDDSTPFWFFRFAPDGTLKEQFNKNGFFGQNSTVLYPLYVTNDPEGNFTFLMHSSVTGPMPAGWLRKINTGLDTIIFADQQYLSENDSNLLKDGFWSAFKTGSDGTIYAIENIVIDTVPQFFVLKLPTDGSPARIFSSGETEYQQFEDFVVTDSSLILTGAYQPDNQSSLRVFVAELDKELNLINITHWTNGEPNTVPHHIHHPASGNLYIKTDQLDSGISTLVSVSPQLLPESEFPLYPGAGYKFADVGLTEGDNGRISLAGFRHAPIYPQDELDSKRDFQVFTFDGLTGAVPWTYQFSDSGISGVFADNLTLDREQNPIVGVEQQEGLDFPYQDIYAPINESIRKYDKNGVLAWAVPLNFFLYKTYSDLNNNLLLHVYDGQDNRILKFSADGEELAQVIIGDYIENVYVDRQNRIHVQLENKIVTLDDNLSVLDQYHVPGKALSIFELPNDSSIYVYSDSIRYNDYTADFYLFKNGVQQWVTELDIQNAYQSGISGFCLNKQNGSLFVSSIGITGYPRLLHSLTLGGVHQFIPLTALSEPQTLGALPNGEIWVFTHSDATLFSPELVQIKTVVDLGSGVLIQNGYLFKKEPGRITVFNGQGDSLAQLNDVRFQEVLIDSSFNLYSAYTFGNYPFSFFRFFWARGTIAKFNLRDYVNFTVKTTDPGQSTIESGKSVFRFNNPVVENLRIQMTGAGQTPERIEFFDTSGKQLKNFSWSASEREAIVPMTGLPPGVYYAGIEGKNGLMATLKVVKTE